MQITVTATYAYIITSYPAVAERPRDMLRVCQQLASVIQTVQHVERNLLVLVTSASDLPLRTNKLCLSEVTDFQHSGE